MKIKIIVILVYIWFAKEIICVNILSKFHQNDYKVRNIRVELLDYNKDLINFLEVKTFKFNRTTTAFNATGNSKVNLSTEVQAVGQVYKFLSNEYRNFPIRMRLSICEMYDANVVGLMAKLSLCGNVTRCFAAKDTTYHVCNFVPDIEHLPPNIPTGEFMIEGEFYYHNTILCRARAYGEVFRPIYPKD